MEMHRGKRTVSLILLAAFFLLLLSGIVYWRSVGAELSNPRADFWRAVRQGIPGSMSAPAEGHTVLILNSGENWREIRNGLIMPASQWVIALALLGMGLFYAFVGPEKLEKPRSGIRIERFTLRERILHWYTAAIFVIMGISGLSLLLGRVGLIPVFGYGAVSAYLGAMKGVHNILGPFLLVGILLEFAVWVRFNIPEKIDLQWFKSMGGMIGSGPRPHIGKINGGEKAWFWAILLFGTVVGVTGVLLDFPIWGQSRLTMQVSHSVHAAAGVLFVTVSFGHIYMGTIGVEGAFEGMWNGSVDAVWAEQNHDLWYEEKIKTEGREIGRDAAERE